MENEHTEYAGFWIRFIAYLIDNVIIGVIEFVIVLPLLGLFGVTVIELETLRDLENADPGLLLPVFASAIAGLVLTVTLITWFYYTLLQSGPRQATLGKMALGLKVTDINGERLTFARASLRYFSKVFLSNLFLMLGYIMAGFTAKKQALHDIIANTYVIKNRIQ